MEKARVLLKQLAEHRQAKQAPKSESAYYELLTKYFDIRVRDEGKPLATRSDVFPVELFYALDFIPFHISMVSCATAVLLKSQDEPLSSAKAFGLPPEVCSVHRIAASFFLKGWAPRPDLVIWDSQTRDNNAKSSELIKIISKGYGLYINYLYDKREQAINYLAHE